MEWSSGEDKMRPIIITAIMVLCLSSSVQAAERHEDQIITTIIGEAADQGDRGMRAHAHAILNRGMMGAHGKNAHRPETAYEYQRAGKAWWNAMAEPDFTGGATHWLSKEDIQIMKKSPAKWSKWCHEFKETITVRDTTFYIRKTHAKNKI